MAAAPAAAPTRPPMNIEDFLWNLHTVLVATPGPLLLDQLKDAYSRHLGHKWAMERFLVVGEGGLAATLKRIPHIATVFQEAGAAHVKATQAHELTRPQLVEADAAYRRDLMKKNAAAKAPEKSSPQAPTQTAKAKAPAGGAAAKAPAAEAAPAAKASAAPAATGEKRPAEGAQAGGEAKKAKGDSDAETLARMLVQGVVRVVQNRLKENKGPLPIEELEGAFKDLWKVPFNVKQTGETDVVVFLKKWPNKVEVYPEGGTHYLKIPNKVDKPKAAGAEAPQNAATASKAAPAATSTKAAPPAATASKAAPVAAVAAKAAAAPKPAAPPAAAAPKEGAAPAPGASAPAATGAKAAASSVAKPPAPQRPPVNIEDFLHNIHVVLESYGGPVPLDSLKEIYSKHLGHKCAIERFLVVGDGGLGQTLKRIPHIVTVVQERPGGPVTLRPTLPPGTTRQELVNADQAYRKDLMQKSAAAKKASAAAPAQAKAAEPRPATEAPAGEKDGKKPRTGTDHSETVAKMLVQGVARLLANRLKDGKGPLPIANLEEEFKNLWKVPFNLEQAGETDVVAFLKKWPSKVEIATEGGQMVVQGVKKAEPNGPPAKAAAATAVDRTQISEVKEQAESMLQTMREMLRKQEELVRVLDRL